MEASIDLEMKANAPIRKDLDFDRSHSKLRKGENPRDRDEYIIPLGDIRSHFQESGFVAIVELGREFCECQPKKEDPNVGSHRRGGRGRSRSRHSKHGKTHSTEIAIEY